MRRLLHLAAVMAACGLLMACQSVPNKSVDANTLFVPNLPSGAVEMPKAAQNPGKPAILDGLNRSCPSLSKSQRGLAPGTSLDLGDFAACDPSDATPKPLEGSLWLRIRQGMGIDPLRGSAQVRMQVHVAWYRQRPEHLQRVFERARPYLFDIVNEVQASGLPMEVALLPAVESAFLPKAVSHAQADGLWQFMAPTAQRFDLRRNMFLDERRNPAAATRAALRYLTLLRDRYGGDMQLALAAYNCGEGCIDSHVRRAQAKGLPGRFEDLNLNTETAHYVPRLMALSRVVAAAVDSANLSEAGLPPLQDLPPVRQVALQRDIDKSLAAKLAQISPAELEALNPQHNKPLLVAAAGQGLVLPLDKAQRFEQALLAHKGPLASWTARRVASNTTVEALARLFGGNAATLRSVNRIAAGHMVVAGSTVLVPRAVQADDVAEAKLNQAVLKTAPALTNVRVKVRKGWGWNEVARELKRSANPVFVEELKKANSKLRLKPGWLRLRVPAVHAPVRLGGDSRFALTLGLGSKHTS